MLDKIKTVVISDNQGRVTIPSKMRELIGNDDSKIVYNVEFDQSENKIILTPIGNSDIK